MRLSRLPLGQKAPGAVVSALKNRGRAVDHELEVDATVGEIEIDR